MSIESTPAVVVDLDFHAARAVAEYRSVRPAYEQLADVAKRILHETLGVADIRVHSIEARAKTLESFEKKAAKPSEADPTRPKYLRRDQLSPACIASVTRSVF